MTRNTRNAATVATSLFGATQAALMWGGVYDTLRSRRSNGWGDTLHPWGWWPSACVATLACGAVLFVTFLVVVALNTKKGGAE